ncbi:hypothetical protein ACS0TY_021314 [Phlomoides rotata]
MEFISYLLDSFDDVFSLDDTYAEELQLQEALQASLSINHATPSSSSTQISCEICVEDKQKSDMFLVEGCTHSFCLVCIRKHIEYKLQDNIIIISCPDQDCVNIIQPSSLRYIVRSEVIGRWEEAIAESTIVASQKIQCPFENCSEIMVNDGGVITECECPWCHRLFCAKCKVPWHHGLDCKEIQRSNRGKKEKEKLKLLARENNWKKCPNCKVFVDKTEGCIHITCRCKIEFCYICGEDWSERHWNTCQE